MVNTYLRIWWCVHDGDDGSGCMDKPAYRMCIPLSLKDPIYELR